MRLVTELVGRATAALDAVDLDGVSAKDVLSAWTVGRLLAEIAALDDIARSLDTDERRELFWRTVRPQSLSDLSRLRRPAEEPAG